MQITPGNQTIILETEKKSGQWLGATLSSSGQDGSVVVSRLIFLIILDCLIFIGSQRSDCGFCANSVASNVVTRNGCLTTSADTKRQINVLN